MKYQLGSDFSESDCARYPKFLTYPSVNFPRFNGHFCDVAEGVRNEREEKGQTAVSGGVVAVVCYIARPDPVAFVTPLPLFVAFALSARHRRHNPNWLYGRVVSGIGGLGSPRRTSDGPLK